MCGEHAFQANDKVVYQGSSPHVRGARHCRDHVTYSCGIIPACAGSTALYFVKSVFRV